MIRITKTTAQERIYYISIFSVPGCRPRYTTCYLKCEHSSNSGQNGCWNQNALEPHKESTSHLHPAKWKKLESKKCNITILQVTDTNRKQSNSIANIMKQKTQKYLLNQSF